MREQVRSKIVGRSRVFVWGFLVVSLPVQESDYVCVLNLEQALVLRFIFGRVLHAIQEV
jgi:hypothetical protein